jgi:hypothetical protein
LVPVAFF